MQLSYLNISSVFNKNLIIPCEEGLCYLLDSWIHIFIFDLFELRGVGRGYCRCSAMRLTQISWGKEKKERERSCMLVCCRIDKYHRTQLVHNNFQRNLTAAFSARYLWWLHFQNPHIVLLTFKSMISQLFNIESIPGLKIPLWARACHMTVSLKSTWHSEQSSRSIRVTCCQHD